MEEPQIRAAKAQHTRIETDIDAFKKRVMDQISEQKNLNVRSSVRYRSSSFRKAAFISAAIAVGLIMTVGSSYVSPAVAHALKRIPLLQSAFEFARGWGLQTADDRELSTKVNQLVERKGITVKLSEIMYDDAQFSIGLIQQAAGGTREIYDVEAYVNGNLIAFPVSPEGGGYEQGQNIRAVILKRESAGLPDQFDLKLKVFLDGYGVPWEFHVPVKKQTVESKTIAPMGTKLSGPVAATVSKVVLTPTETNIEFELTVPIGVTEDPEYRKLLSSIESGKVLVQNERGIVLEYYGVKGTSVDPKEGKHVTAYELKYSAFKTMPKFLRIRPYTWEGESHEIIQVPLTTTPSAEQPLVLDQGEQGRIFVTDIEFLEDKTRIHYRTEGLDPYDIDYFGLIDAKGNRARKTIRRKIVDPEKYTFIKELGPLNKNEQWIIESGKRGGVARFFRDLEMDVEIK